MQTIMKTLIIGGAGFLGSNLVRACLTDSGSEITVLDSLDPHFLSSRESLRDVEDSIRFIQGDLCDDALLTDLVKGQDVIFNCAAQTSHPLSIREPLLDVRINCVGNLKLLEAVRRFNPGAALIYPSSSTVIGKALIETVDEDHWERPLEIYSANKSVAEKYYQIYHTVHGLRTAVIRFANLYGPHGKNSPDFGFMNYFIAQAAAGKRLRVFGDGSQMRNVMYVGDAVSALRTAAEQCDRLAGKPWFATGDEHLSVLEIAEAIAAEFSDGVVERVPWPPERKAIEIENVHFSSERFRAQTGWSPVVSFAEGLRKTKDWMNRGTGSRIERISAN
jgi:UDP-glucose 4-epimerase